MDKEIEVGEYVRTERGIGKILETKTVQPKMYGKHDVAYLIDICPRMYVTDNIFTKHSHNILKLLEVGDIVELIDVLNKEVIYIWDNEMLKAVKEDIENGLKLGRILTKEQFNANCYEVKE